MDKHTQTIRRQQATNWLSLFDHFVGLAFKGLRASVIFLWFCISRCFVTMFNSCLATGFLLYPLKTLENLWGSGDFTKYKEQVIWKTSDMKWVNCYNASLGFLLSVALHKKMKFSIRIFFSFLQTLFFVQCRLVYLLVLSGLTRLVISQSLCR